MMNLPWVTNIAELTIILMYVVTAVGGHGMWRPVSWSGVEAGFYLGTVLCLVSLSIYNIWRAYREGTGKMRTFGEAIRPLVSVTLAMMICFWWVLFSNNNILEEDVSCFFFMTGTLFSNICCKLIIAPMADTRP